MTFARMLRSTQAALQNVKIVVWGPDNAGKSTILNRYLGVDITVAPTFGYKIHTKQYRDFTVTLIDIGGQDVFTNFLSNYFEGADAVVLVFDCSDTRPLDFYIETALNLNIPTAIFYNKCDINPTPKYDIKGNHMRFKSFLTSASLNLGIEEGFLWILSEVRK
ncbi:ADP-ribosylation factor-like protein 2 [Pancytospora epiphaga]|nr:ADP-ribosylation factor-like protein 2 [Pancytospora epiphaga]